MLSILWVMYLSVLIPERDIKNKGLRMEALCQHKLSHQAICIIMTMSTGRQGSLTIFLSSQLLREKEFGIRTICITTSVVIIFMLGFIADTFTLHLQANNWMRISPLIDLLF